MNKYAITQKQRDEHKRYHRATGKHHQTVGSFRRLGGAAIVLSYVLLGAGIWALLLVYGPVAAVEAGYQYKMAVSGLQDRRTGTWGFLIPHFSFDLVRPELAQGYGIVIPKIYVSETVVVNVDPMDKSRYLPALQKGIAHAAGTSLPGEGGLGYYFAHSSGIGGVRTGFNAVFYLLGKLEIGDEVRIYREGERFTYRVVEVRVTEADEVAFLAKDGEKERIVLQTCWPVGTSAKRLLVSAERVS